jgi:hypothetical protein
LSLCSCCCPCLMREEDQSNSRQFSAFPL